MCIRVSRSFIVPLLASILCVSFNPFIHSQVPGTAYDRPDMLSIELWSIDDRIIHGDVSPEERFLVEAQYTISGMIYGWAFRYVPEAPDREVAMEFELQPHAFIPWGDPALVVREMRSADNILYGVIDYRLSRDDQARRDSWQSIATVRSGGIGSEEILMGTQGKLHAIETAVRDAIDRHLRIVVPNRPRAAYGDVILAEEPLLRPVAGLYEARVRVLVRIEEIQPYLVY